MWTAGSTAEGIKVINITPPRNCLSVGVNVSVKFYCEAKNARGISVSRTGTIHIKGEFTCWSQSAATFTKKIILFIVLFRKFAQAMDPSANVSMT